MPDRSEEPLPVSGLHELLGRASGRPTDRYPSFAAARSDPDAAVVASGDDGGTVLLTAPLRLVACDASTLRRLAVDLDGLLWDDPTGVELSFLHLPVGSGVPGGMGGGVVVEGMWIHPCIDRTVAKRASAVLAGLSAGLAISESGPAARSPEQGTPSTAGTPPTRIPSDQRTAVAIPPDAPHSNSR